MVNCDWLISLAQLSNPLPYTYSTLKFINFINIELINLIEFIDLLDL